MSSTRCFPFAALVILTLCTPLAGTAADLSGYYFGSFSNTSGAWACRVRPYGVFDFIGYLPEHAEPIHSYLYGADVSPTGAFTDVEPYLGYSIVGKIGVDRAVSGTYAKLTSSGVELFSESFSGKLDASGTNFAWPIAGYYDLAATSKTDLRVAAIVGQSGRIVVVAERSSTEWKTGASGNLDSEGRVHFDSSNGLRGEFSIDPTGTAHARLSAPGSSEVVEFSGSAEINRIVNLSSRVSVGAGENVLIGGFVVGGSTPKRVLIRATGPSLAPYLSNPGAALADPQIRLMHDGVEIGRADNWGEGGNGATLLDAMRSTGAFLPANGSKDAMMLLDLPPGAYTAVISGAPGTSGLALAEIYAVNDRASRNSRLVNISTRGFVGPGDSVMIAGMVPDGTAARLMLVRAVGPTLRQSPFNVPNALTDPVLAIYQKGQAAPILTNDDWGIGAGQLPDFIEEVSSKVGAFTLPRGSRDSVALVYVQPNIPYTVVVSGKSGTTGVALVEIYEVEPLP